jgi:hypothetical protein
MLYWFKKWKLKTLIQTYIEVHFQGVNPGIYCPQHPSPILPDGRKTYGYSITEFICLLDGYATDNVTEMLLHLDLYTTQSAKELRRLFLVQQNTLHTKWLNQLNMKDEGVVEEIQQEIEALTAQIVKDKTELKKIEKTTLKK